MRPMSVSSSHRTGRHIGGPATLSCGRTVICVVCLAAAGVLVSGCHTAERGRAGSAESQAGIEQSADAVPAAETAAKVPEKPQFPLDPGQEVSLFNGQTLGLWKVTDFGGQGDVHIEDGAITMETGSYMTGVTWTGPVARMDYEITLEGMRVRGNDFFCALTFPVGEKPCTLVLGGWGGSVCGLSNIDYYDAAENETTRVMHFENGKWYHVRLRVVPDRIQAWLDGEELVNIETTGRKIDIRPEVDLSQPLGIATWMTTGAVRNIRLKKLSQETP